MTLKIFKSEQKQHTRISKKGKIFIAGKGINKQDDLNQKAINFISVEDNIPTYEEFEISIGSDKYRMFVEDWFPDCLESRGLGNTSPSRIKTLYKNLMEKETKLKADIFGYIPDYPGSEFGISFIGEKIHKESDNIKKLYHGTDIDSNIILKEGLKMPPGKDFMESGYPGIFTSDDKEYSKTYGKNLFIIDTSNMNIAKYNTKENDMIQDEFYDVADSAKDLSPISKKFANMGIDAVEMADGIIFLRDIKPEEIKLSKEV